MKIIFLDIDGVVSLSGDKMVRTQITPELTTPYMWNEQACEIVERILHSTGAEIVLSSDWRKHYRLQEMRAIMQANGISGGRLVGYTSIDPAYAKSRGLGSMAIYRSKEINEWLGLHGVKQWVAVDDLHLVGLDHSRFVCCTDTHKGITVKDMEELIISKLNGSTKGEG